MSQPNWPGTAGFPAIPYRGAWTEKSVQLPFATGNGESAATTPKVFWGTGSPNGVVTGKRGDEFNATDTGHVWAKFSGTNTNTGWEVISRLVDVTAYGAKGDGVTDDSAAIQLAANAASATGGVLYFPVGTFKFGGVTLNSSPTGVTNEPASVRGAGRGATYWQPTTMPALTVGGATNGTYGFKASDLTVQLTSQQYWARGAIRLIRTVYVDLRNIDLVSGTNRGSDLYTYSGYLFEFDSSFLIKMDRCDAEGHGVYLFEWHSESVAAIQLDTVEISNCEATGMALGILRGPNGSTDMHNIILQTPKHVMVSGWDETNASTETTLSSSPSAGASSFTIASATGIAVGDFLWLGIGATIELVKVATLVGTTVTTANMLRYAHTSGDLVLLGGFMLATAPRTYNVILNQPHSEFSATCVYNGGARLVRVADLYGSCKEILRQAAPGGASTTYGLKVERAQWHWGGSGSQYAIRVLAGGDGTSNTYFLEGPFVDPNTGNPPATLYVNDAATTRFVFARDVLSSGVPVETRTGPTQSLTTLAESWVVGGSTIHERDWGGGLYSIRHSSKAGAPTDGATVTPDVSQGNYLRFVLGGSRTIAAPTNPPATGRAQLVTFEIFNNTGGAMTTTWDAIYVMQAAWVDPATGKSRQITFGYNWSRNKWLEVSRTTADT